MSPAVSQRMIGQPTNTGSQQVSAVERKSTDGTPMAGGPNAARPPIGAASTAPTPPGGRRRARVPLTMVTTVTVTKTCRRRRLDAGPQRQRRPSVVAAHNRVRSPPSRFGSRIQLDQFAADLLLSLMPVPSHRRSRGTNRKAPSATDHRAGRAGGRSARSGERSADAPAATLKKISSATWVITWTDCCSATAAVARSVPRPAFCRNRCSRQAADTGRGGGRGERVGGLHDDQIAEAHRFRRRWPTRRYLAPTYVNADTVSPSSAHHQFAEPTR